MPPLGRKAASKPKRKPKAAPKSPGLQQYAATTVRAHEEGSKLNRYRQTTVLDLIRRFCKFVAVCQTRQAQGVASAKFGVYMRKTTSRKTAWDTRPLLRKELLRQRARGGGFITRKAAEISDDVEEVIDPLHPLVRLLATANVIMNGYGLFEQTQLGIGLTGDAYWHVVFGEDGIPAEIWPLAPQYIRPLPSRERIVSGYVYGRGMENEEEIDAAEIIRFTQPNPFGDPFQGFGDVAKCLDDADLSVAFSQFRLATIDNGAQPGLVIHGKTMGIEQRQQLEDQLQRKHGGLAKVGRSLILTGDLTIDNWGMNEKEAAFLNSELVVKETVCNCHDYPMSLMTMDQSALATAQVAVQHWQEFGRKPRVDRIADTMNERLVPMFGDDRLYICPEEVVTKDLEKTTAMAVSMYSSGLAKQNEARSWCDLDSVPGGDKFKHEIEPQPDPLGPGGASGGGGSKPPVDSGGGSSDDADEPEKSKSIGRISVGIEADTTRLRSQLESIRTEFGNGSILLRNTTIATPKIEPISQKALILSGQAMSCCPHHPRNMRKDAATDTITLTERQLEGIIRQWFGEITPQLTAKMTPRGLPSDVKEVLEVTLKAATEAPIRQIFTHGYNFGVQELPTRGNAEIMAVLTGPAEKYLREHEGKLVRSVSDTVDHKIRNDLADGVQAGESTPELSTRLKSSVDEMSGVGSERIARTETARAFMAAREDSWKESGVVWGKRWQLAPEACEFCEAAAREYGVQPLGSPFFKRGAVLTGTMGGSMKMDYADVDGPPLHPNDRCSIVMVMEPPK
jgi:HK97 family phage portal protein